MRRKFLSVVLCVCMMMTMVPFAFAAEGDGNGTQASNTITLDEFLTRLADAKYDYDGNGITVKWSPVSGCFDTRSGHTCSVGNVTATGNTPKRVNNGLTQFQLFEGTTHAVSVKNVNFVYDPTDVTICINSGWAGTFTTSDAPAGQLYLMNTGDVTFEGCTFDKVVVTSFNCAGTSTVKNCEFKNVYNNYAIKDIRGQNVVVTNNKITDCGGGIMVSSTSDVNAVTIENNTFNNVDVADTALAEKVGTRGLIQFASTGTYTNATYALTGNTATNCGPVLRQLNSTVSLDTTPLNSLVGAGAATLYTTDSTQPVAQIGNTSYPSVSSAISAATTGQTITILRDVSENVTISTDKTITINLDTNTWSVPNDTGIKVQGQLTITGNGTITCQKTPIGVNAGSVVIENSTIESKGDYGIYTANGGSVTVNAGTISSQYAALAGNNTTGTMNFTVAGGTLTAAQGPAIYMPGQVALNISGGTLNGGISLRMGQVNVSGGTINATTGSIDSPSEYYNYSGNAWLPDALYVFGGTYPNGDEAHGNSLNLNITGGTFNCTNGQGSAVAIYDLGKVTQTANVTISDTAKLATNASSRSAYQVLSLNDIGVTSPADGYGANSGHVNSSITGGYFTTDPSDYLASNKAAVESDLAGYNYMVKEKTTTPATVASAAPSVDTTGLSEEQQKVVGEITKKLDSNTVTGDGLTAAANTIANDNDITTETGKTALENNQINTTGETTRIVIQTYMDIDIKDINTSDNASKTLTLDITPMYRTVATTSDTDDGIKIQGETNDTANAVLVGPAGKLTINKPVTVSIPLPSGFASNGSAYVQHKGYEYTASVVSDIATFVNPHGFSSFTITAAPTAVATVDGTSYTSLQAAVDAVKDGETITLTKTCSETATVSRNVKFTLANANQLTGTISASGRYNLTKVDNTTANTTDYTVTYVGGSSSGSGSASTTYNVTVNAATNGTVAADKKTAAKGTTVTITATPSAGYVVDAVKVVDKDGKDVAVTAKDGKYVFTMPASAVTVTASFKAETPAPSGLPFVDVKSGDWFYDAVKYAYEQGLMTGTSATTFAPNGTMNRAMIVTVLYRLEKSPAVTAPAKFADVPAGQWYSDAVAWAAANNIVNGYNETTFGPMNAVTREQMAAILYRYEQYKGMDTVTLEENLSRFPDKDKVSAYAVPAMQWAVGQKVINGNADGTLNPTGTSTRAQVAQIFTNLLNK